MACIMGTNMAMVAMKIMLSMISMFRVVYLPIFMAIAALIMGNMIGSIAIQSSSVLSAQRVILPLKSKCMGTICGRVMYVR